MPNLKSAHDTLAYNRMNDLVIDASVAFEYLLQTDLGIEITDMLESAPSLFSPEIMDAEVLSTLRGAVMRGHISTQRAQTIIEDLINWDIQRISHRQLARYAWQYRHNLSAYDSFYVAAAHAKGATLITADRRISRAPGLDIDIVTV